MDSILDRMIAGTRRAIERDKLAAAQALAAAAQAEGAEADFRRVAETSHHPDAVRMIGDAERLRRECLEQAAEYNANVSDRMVYLMYLLGQRTSVSGDVEGRIEPRQVDFVHQAGSVTVVGTHAAVDEPEAPKQREPEAIVGDPVTATGELEESEPKRRSSRLTRAALRGDATDPAKSLAESASNVSKAFQRDLGPPVQPATVAEVLADPRPVFQEAPPPSVGAGDLAMAGVALGVVVKQGASTVTSAVRRWTGRTRERKQS